MASLALRREFMIIHQLRCSGSDAAGHTTRLLVIHRALVIERRALVPLRLNKRSDIGKLTCLTVRIHRNTGHNALLYLARVAGKPRTHGRRHLHRVSQRSIAVAQNRSPAIIGRQQHEPAPVAEQIHAVVTLPVPQRHLRADTPVSSRTPALAGSHASRSFRRNSSYSLLRRQLPGVSPGPQCHYNAGQ